MSTFLDHYIAAVIFTDTGEAEQPPSDAEFSPEAIASAEADCEAFQKAAAADLAEAYERAGYDFRYAAHDFWLTRNGHGAGFWDRDALSDGLGDRLTAHCKAFKQVDTYEGDDGKIYFA